MEKTGQSYSSGEWLVQPGSEEEFIQKWTNFLQWSLNNAPGAVSAVLVRSAEEPRRFLSLGAWENQEALERWRQMDQMQELLGQARELCEEFEAHFYTLAASPKGPLGGVTDTVGGVTDTVRGTTDRLLGGGGKEEQR
jgi:heme-degrading monooxygenase HmoA